MNGSAAAIFGQKVVFGGGAPVALNNFVWPSSSSIMASSICLASFVRSGAIDFGVAQPQISSQAKGLVRLGTRRQRAAARFLASCARSGAIACGIAQPQISSQAKGLVRSGPSGKRAAATLPAIFDL